MISVARSRSAPRLVAFATIATFLLGSLAFASTRPVISADLSQPYVNDVVLAVEEPLLGLDLGQPDVAALVADRYDPLLNRASDIFLIRASKIGSGYEYNRYFE